LQRTTDYIKGISDTEKILGTLKKAMEEKDKKTLYCFLERARTQLPDLDWENNEVIKQAKQVATELW
jgi:predicted ester cyclase